MDMERDFWKTTTLEQMSEAQWEALCDGCGRCCLHKLQDEDTGRIVYTRVACKLLDVKLCRCSNYPQRRSLVPDCLVLDRAGTNFHWLPTSCAYRRLSEGRGLDWWHPLVSGDPGTVHRADISVVDFALSETVVHPEEIEHCLAEWIDTDDEGVRP